MNHLYETIPSEDISIIIQGPLYRIPRSEKSVGIFQSLPALRTLFPNSQIIISTWDTEPTEGLIADEIILNKDPGAFKDINATTRNFNRQIVSTLSGLKVANRKYVLKTRSDLLFTSTQFARISPASSNSLLKSKITISNLVLRKPESVPFLYHLSDVVQFGLTEDIRDLWTIPYEEEHEVCGLKLSSLIWRFSSSRFKFHPEQSLCTRWLRKHNQNVVLTNPAQITFNFYVHWMQILTSNFHVVDYRDSGIQFPHHFFTSAYSVKWTLYYPEHLSRIASSLHSGLEMRKMYTWVWVNKYILSFFQLTFILGVTSNILYALSPALHKRVFTLYRKFRGR